MPFTGNAKRILDLLAQRSALDDDEISRALGIRPRQQVNQICRKLAQDGVLRREYRPRGKIVNVLLQPAGGASVRLPTLATKKIGDIPVKRSNPASERRLAMEETLFIIPCSGAKRGGGSVATLGRSIVEDLSGVLAAELLDARRRVRSAAKVDESRLIPAWQRYTGMFYQAGGRALEKLIRDDCHVIILSGGYGVVLATEPIGYYEAVLNPALWPNRLLQRILEHYAKKHRLPRARAFASKTTAYQKVLKRVDWRDAGVIDALLISPDAAPGAMVKSPSAQGEALEALISGTLSPAWRSSNGLGIEVSQLG